MTRRPSLDFRDLPPMVARPLDDTERAVAPAFAHLADLNRQMAEVRWMLDNDPEERT